MAMDHVSWYLLLVGFAVLVMGFLITPGIEIAAAIIITASSLMGTYKRET